MRLGTLLNVLGPPEVIGNPECPILYRWTLLHLGGMKDESGWHNCKAKLMLHRFMPNTTDREYHDHPWAFVTVVLQGGYDDYSLGVYEHLVTRRTKPDRLRRGSLRYRPAKHSHITRSGSGGAWTLVFTGPFTRSWGFWVNKQWWPHRKYGEVFGYGMQCE